MKYGMWLDEWFRNYIQPSSKIKTCERYSEIIEKHLKVKLGEYELDELTPLVLQRYVTGLMQSGNIVTGKGLAANSVNGIITVIQNSLKLAYTLGELKEYTADKIKRPKTKEKEVSCFSLAEQKKIEQAALSSKKRKFIGIVICLYSGLRIGELLALTWSDIDFTKGTLAVNKTCHDGRDEKGNLCRITDLPKTASSKRMIPLPKQLLPVLKEYKRKSISEYVVESENGEPPTVRSYQRTFELLQKRLHTLVVTRELKNYGVEVYFVEDNIRTMDGDGELRLTIMATLAQEESRKISERVRAGQKISRDKGVLFGNGNILGYDRDKAKGTYVINPEQAETVRMIYDMYSAGKGMSQIRNELIRLKRKDSSGLVRWENCKIARILHNSTYKGYPAYLKSRRNNFLDQKIIRNRDEDTYLYVKGDFEPIISEKQWDRCRQIREQRVRRNKILTENGEKSHLTGVHTSDDVWTKKLRCRCGYRMRRNKWRKNRNGELIYGYKCYNQLNNGTKTTRLQAGVDDAGFCDLKEICDWKLEMMARRIFSGLWGNKKDILNKVSSLYQVGVFMEYREAETVKDRVTEQLAKLDEKLKKLTRMRLEDEITRESYFEFKSEIEKEKLDLLSKRRVLDAGMVPNGNPEDPAKKAEDFLLAKMDFTDHRIDRDVIGQFVGTIVPVTETCFNWYMNFDLADKSDDMKRLVWEFTIDYKEAKSYRKERDGMLRQNQWHDLTVRVFM